MWQLADFVGRRRARSHRGHSRFGPERGREDGSGGGKRRQNMVKRDKKQLSFGPVELELPASHPGEPDVALYKRTPVRCGEVLSTEMAPEAMHIAKNQSSIRRKGENQSPQKLQQKHGREEAQPKKMTPWRDGWACAEEQDKTCSMPLQRASPRRKSVSLLKCRYRL